jgi:hypothetical protein
MVEPITTSLLLAVVGELARAGTGMLFQRLTQRGTVTSIATVNLSAGISALATSQVRVTFAAIASGAPYWIWFGLQHRDGWQVNIPVLYREQAKLILPRGQYEMLALFLAKPTSFLDKPLLMAVGRHHDVIASGSVQPVRITGKPPTDQEITSLRSRFPDPPFRLPLTTAELAQFRAQLVKFRSTASKGVVTGQARTLRLGVRELRIIRPALNPPAPPLTPAPRPLTTSRPRGTVAPQVAVRPAALVCRARTSKGIRCTNRAGVTSGNLCQMHLDMLVAGKEVRWHDSDERVRLACHAKLDSGARCRNAKVRDQLCDSHLTRVAAGKRVFWYGSGERVSLKCGARTRRGVRCQNDPIRHGLCQAHLNLVKHGHQVVWHETGTRARIGSK